MKLIESRLSESGIDGAKIQPQLRELIFQGGKEPMLKLLELELLEPQDLVPVFSVPLP
jgi:hypothetical protein